MHQTFVFPTKLLYFISGTFAAVFRADKPWWWWLATTLTCQMTWSSSQASSWSLHMASSKSMNLTLKLNDTRFKKVLFQSMKVNQIVVTWLDRSNTIFLLNWLWTKICAVTNPPYTNGSIICGALMSSYLCIYVFNDTIIWLIWLSIQNKYRETQ